MIPASRWLPVGLLPHMRHFMRKRRENHFISTPGKIVRVEGKFMDCRCIDAPAKPFRGKVASRIRVALQCHQDLGQAAIEQLAVEKVVGTLETLVFSYGNGCCLHNNCIVLYNYLLSTMRYY